MKTISKLTYLSILAFGSAFISPAQADTQSTNYPGLSCVPHDPTSAQYAYGTFTDIYNVSDQPGSDLGLNCAIPRTDEDKELKSISVVVSDSDAAASDYTFCHTHNETLSATGEIDYAFGPDVSVYNANGLYNTVTVPGPGAPASASSNFNLHCHIGQYASLHNYTARVRKD